MVNDHEIVQFSPDYAVHPGEILEETLEARAIKKTAFAKSCGLSEKTISQIINGKAPVTPETAIQFERVLDVPASVWNNLESFYRLHRARVSERKELKDKIAWAKIFPVKELVNRGYLERPCNQVDRVEKLLNFFAVGSVEAWQDRFAELSVAFRHSPSFESAPASVAIWLRTGELCAQDIETEPFEKSKFIAALKNIRTLTDCDPEIFQPRMEKLCRKSGVAVVFVSEFPGTHLSGATRWLNKGKALIMLSLRHKTDDHMWFTFFHEAAHVLLHGKKKLFLDDVKTMKGGMEDEANRFAANTLIPEEEYKTFVSRRSRFYKRDISAFARRLNIAPGIVVGRLQHEGKILYNWHNDLKRKFELVESNE